MITAILYGDLRAKFPDSVESSFYKTLESLRRGGDAGALFFLLLQPHVSTKNNW